MTKINMTRRDWRNVFGDINGFFFAVPALSRGKLDKDNVLVFKLSKSYLEKKEIRNAFISLTNDRAHGYVTKAGVKWLLANHEPICTVSRAVIESFEGKNMGFKFENLMCLLFGGSLTDREQDIEHKIDVTIDGVRYPNWQCKYSAHSENAASNKKESYSTFNWVE